MKRTRVFQITVLLLVVVAAVQVGYWLFDQHLQGAEKTVSLMRLYDQQTAAAQRMLSSGVPVARIQDLFPDLAVSADHVALAPEHLADLMTQQQHRLTQYLWEGGFFLFALFLCIGAIFGALRGETRVLNEQEQFLALVSHQFKTPLASLQLSLETMSLRQLPPEHSRALVERMLSDLTRMTAMVGQILDSSRLSHGRMDLKSEPVPLDVAVYRIMLGDAINDPAGTYGDWIPTLANRHRESGGELLHAASIGYGAGPRHRVRRLHIKPEGFGRCGKVLV